MASRLRLVVCVPRSPESSGGLPCALVGRRAVRVKDARIDPEDPVPWTLGTQYSIGGRAVLEFRIAFPGLPLGLPSRLHRPGSRHACEVVLLDDQPDRQPGPSVGRERQTLAGPYVEGGIGYVPWIARIRK